MRKFLIIGPLLSFLVMLFLFQASINKSRDPIEPRPQNYYFEKPFYFFSSYEKEDLCFLEKIQSMLDQEYTNFSIVLYMKKKDAEIVELITFYAKRKNKSHLLEIIEIDDFHPLFHEIEKKAALLKNNEIIISIEKNCILSSDKFLQSLNLVFQNRPLPMLVYTNYTKFPSLLQNSSPICYESSPLKTIYSNHIRFQNKSKKIDTMNIDSLFKFLAQESKCNCFNLQNNDYLQRR